MPIATVHGAMWHVHVAVDKMAGAWPTFTSSEENILVCICLSCSAKTDQPWLSRVGLSCISD